MSSEGSLDTTIQNRTKIQVGLILREAMFINGILYDSEAWQGVNKGYIAQLSKVDHQILRSVLSTHAKIPTEILYLETGVLPVKYFISVRRLYYFPCDFV